MEEEELGEEEHLRQEEEEEEKEEEEEEEEALSEQEEEKQVRQAPCWSWRGQLASPRLRHLLVLCPPGAGPVPPDRGDAAGGPLPPLQNRQWPGARLRQV